MSDQYINISIDKELETCYLSYAMSVIIGRALPSIKDGLKPVHRRILFAQRELANYYNRPYKKSARIVGDVIGKYHPHGDVAVYDALARFAQDFSLRYPLADGQGNFGSMDGDSPAAMRYTEIRLARIANTMLDDLDKETVDSSANYDGTELIPDVLPARIPNLLVNGANGIAVGVATSIPPHNLTEVCNAALAMIDDPNIDDLALLDYVSGPDFPTGGIINGISGVHKAYATGSGTLMLRARATVEEEFDGKRDRIVITEMPYMVKKAELVEKMGLKVRDKDIEGISEIRDESNKDGVRLVIECKRGEDGHIVLNNLWKKTELQHVVSLNFVCIENSRPVRVTLRKMINAWLNHRREVVLRRTAYELRESLKRGHRLEGMALALANIDEVLKLIRSAADRSEVCDLLTSRTFPLGNVQQMIERATMLCIPEDMDANAIGIQGEGKGLPLSSLEPTHEYRMSRVQAEAIADMRLHRLTNLEQNSLRDEYVNVLAEIVEYRDILSSNERLTQVIKDEIHKVIEDFGDERRTAIEASESDLTNEDLITPEDRILTLSHQGYIKSQAATDYKQQNRGGVGRNATGLKEDDYIAKILVSNTHTTILFFTNIGRVFRQKLYQIPPSSYNQRGRPIVNMLKLMDGETVTNMMALDKGDDQGFIITATEQGVIKKTPVEAFSNIRSNGLIALNLREGDSLIGAALSNGDQEIMLVTDQGLANKFHENEVRSMGRTATGVRGIRVSAGVRVMSLLVPESETDEILFATEHGYGKRVPFNLFNRKHRGTKGNIAMDTKERNGKVVVSQIVDSQYDLALITSLGKMIRMPIDQVAQLQRGAKGVRLQRLNSEQSEKLIGAAVIREAPPEDEDDINTD